MFNGREGEREKTRSQSTDARLIAKFAINFSSASASRRRDTVAADDDVGRAKFIERRKIVAFLFHDVRQRNRVFGSIMMCLVERRNSRDSWAVGIIAIVRT